MNQGVDYSRLPLRDIHLPDPVGWWPPAPGWWVLALIVIAGCVFLVVRHHRRCHVRAALRAVGRVSAALDAGERPIVCMQRLSVLMRRFAMTVASGRQTDVAGLAGLAWLEYLDSRWSRDAFCSEGAALVAAPYAPDDAVSREQVGRLAALCREWIKAQPV